MYSKLTFDEDIELGRLVEPIENFEIVRSWVYSPALAEKKSVGRSEHYQAALVGLKPVYIFIVHDFEYQNQERVRYQGIEYEITKVYIADGLAELTVSTWTGVEKNG